LFFDEQKVCPGSRTFQAKTAMSVQELADRLGQNRDKDARFHIFVPFFECLAALRTFLRLDIANHNLVAAPARMEHAAAV
jgi:hypothetical protein